MPTDSGWRPAPQGSADLGICRQPLSSQYLDLLNYLCLSWTGNDSTFSTAGSVALNTPTTLTVAVHPASAGAHSAILNLDDATTVGIDAQTLNTVVAAEQFSVSNNYSATHSGTAGRNQVTSYFFNVPAHTPVFKVDLTGGGTTPGTGQIRFLRFHPYGVALDDNSSLSCYNPTSGSCGGSPTSRRTSNPQAGVWEVTVEARRTSDAENAPHTLTASILGATVSPNPDTIASATLGVPVQRSYPIRNVFGQFAGRAVGSTLGCALTGMPSIANGESQQRRVVVTPGSTSLRATIGGTSDLGADLDLFVYNCTTGSCVLAGQSADGDSEESVTIGNPAAGAWIVLVDGYNVPSGSTTFYYVDVFTNSTFGSVAVTDANAVRPANSRVDGAGHRDGERGSGRWPGAARVAWEFEPTPTCWSAPAMSWCRASPRNPLAQTRTPRRSDLAAPSGFVAALPHSGGEERRASVGQFVGPLVARVAGMALDPAPIDIVTRRFGVQASPEIIVLDRLLRGVLPAVALPAVNPLRDAFEHVPAVGVEHDCAGLG